MLSANQRLWKFPHFLYTLLEASTQAGRGETIQSIPLDIKATVSKCSIDFKEGISKGEKLTSQLLINLLKGVQNSAHYTN